MNGLRSLPTGSHLAMDNQLVFFGKENTRDKILDVVVVAKFLCLLLWLKCVGGRNKKRRLFAISREKRKSGGCAKLKPVIPTKKWNEGKRRFRNWAKNSKIRQRPMVPGQKLWVYMRMGALVSMASMPPPSCAYSMASDKVGTVPPERWGRRGIRRDIDLKKGVNVSGQGQWGS